MQGFLKQSTAVNVTVMMIDSADHISGKTGLTLTIYASKAAAAPAAITPTVTELDSTNTPGLYKLALTTGNTDTLGELELHVTGTGADPADFKWQVVSALPGDGVNVTQWSGQNVVTPNSNGVPIVDTRSVLRQGTAQSTGNSTTAIKLDSGASATDSYYVGMLCQIISGTGAPQVGLVVAYVGSTKIATIAPAWPTAPDNTSVFQLLPGIVDVETQNGLQYIEGSYTLTNILRGLAAANLGKASGLTNGASSPVYRDTGDTKNRISATTDANGNRSAVTLNLT